MMCGLAQGGKGKSHWIPRYLVQKDNAAGDPLHLSNVLRHILDYVVFSEIGAGGASDVSPRLFIITTVKGSAIP